MARFALVCLHAGAFAANIPAWTAPLPRPLPLAGFNATRDATFVQVFNATPPEGTYNHAAMLDVHNGRFFLSWKNNAINEDVR